MLQTYKNCKTLNPYLLSFILFSNK